MLTNAETLDIWSKAHPDPAMQAARLRCLAARFPVGSKVRTKEGVVLTVVRGDGESTFGGNPEPGCSYGSAFRSKHGARERNYIATVSEPLGGSARGFYNGHDASNLEIIKAEVDPKLREAAEKFPAGIEVEHFGNPYTVIDISDRTDEFARRYLNAANTYKTVSKTDGNIYVSLRAADGSTYGKQVDSVKARGAYAEGYRAGRLAALEEVKRQITDLDPSGWPGR